MVEGLSQITREFRSLTESLPSLLRSYVTDLPPATSASVDLAPLQKTIVDFSLVMEKVISSNDPLPRTKGKQRLVTTESETEEVAFTPKRSDHKPAKPRRSRTKEVCVRCGVGANTLTNGVCNPCLRRNTAGIQKCISCQRETTDFKRIVVFEHVDLDEETCETYIGIHTYEERIERAPATEDLPAKRVSTKGTPVFFNICLTCTPDSFCASQNLERKQRKLDVSAYFRVYTEHWYKIRNAVARSKHLMPQEDVTKFEAIPLELRLAAWSSACGSCSAPGPFHLESCDTTGKDDTLWYFNYVVPDCNVINPFCVIHGQGCNCNGNANHAAGSLVDCWYQSHQREIICICTVVSAGRITSGETQGMIGYL